MMDLFCKKNILTDGFYKPVELNGMKLDDEYFVQIDHDMLDLISKFQLETDPDSYISKWEKRIGEKLFLYKFEKYPFICSAFGPVNCNRLANNVSDFETDDVRLADKDTLTRTAARKVAEICYHGKGDFNDPGRYAAIAMILYIRNGYNKKDFWVNFKKEFLLGVKELLESDGSIQVGEELLGNPFKYEDATIMNIIDIAKADADCFGDDSFVILDSEIAEYFKRSDKRAYNDEEIDQALGQYVYVKEHVGRSGISKECILNDAHPSLLFMQSLDTSAYIAASGMEDFIFNKQFGDTVVRDDLSEGIAVYRKNNLPESDFWKNMCRQIIYIYERRKF